MTLFNFFGSATVLNPRVSSAVMKYLFAVISVLVLSFSMVSCKKESDDSEQAVAEALPGNWELRQAGSSMLPLQTYAPGNGTRYFFSDSTYQRYFGGNLVGSGSYRIVRDSSVVAETGMATLEGQFKHRIIFDTVLRSPKTFIEISRNRLAIVSGYFPLDGGSHMVYERVASGN